MTTPTSELIVAWLKENPGSSARKIARAISYDDDRHVFNLLEIAEMKGEVQRSRRRISLPWEWKVVA